ncbi:NAD-P-binding protein [Panus rudis PR-1116 ss-1]|nr:NAD-P-binding protein [Panus rudis PR-1116 ss-1]
MPAVNSGKVLVTGANGFVASWVVKSLLEQGYSVRGTVRSASKAAHLQKLFAGFGDKLELVVVDDITKPGAFDEAVQGVDAIQHTASPFHFNAADPQDIIRPAVAGTTSVLESARKYGSGVRRVVVMSSVAAVQENNLAETRIFSESSFNEKSISEVETKGQGRGPGGEAELQWDLVVLNPPFVFGPVIHEVSEPSALNTSMNMWYFFVLKGAADKDTLANFGADWVDVRDLGNASTVVLKKEEVGGQRFIVSAGPWKWQDWVNAARKISPAVPAGNEEYKSENAVHKIKFDTSRSERVLGIQYRSMDETTRDILAEFEKRGWWGEK